MKNVCFRIVPLAFVAAMAIAGFQSCSKFEDLIDGVPIYIDTDLLENSLSVSFVNANPNSSLQPTDIEVKIVGRDADKVYSLLGERNIGVADKMLKVGIKKSQIPCTRGGEQIEFTAIVKAKGFADCIHTFRLTGSEPVHTFLNLIAKNDPPAGASFDEFALQSGTTGLSGSKEFATSMRGKQENAELSLATGTTFASSKGTAVAGELSLSLSHFDNRSDQVMSNFPGDLSTEAVGANGENLGYVRMLPISFGNMSMATASDRVASFSKPANFSVRVNTDFVNPSTEKPVQPGDAIDLWSYDTEQLVWRKVQTTTIQSVGGHLVAPFSITAPVGQWSVGFVVTGNNNVRINFHSNVKMTDPEQYYYVIIRNVLKPLDPYSQVLFEGYMRLFDGEFIFLNNVPDYGLAQIEVWSSKFDCNGRKRLDDQYVFWAPFVDYLGCGMRDYSLVNAYFDPATINANNRFPISVDVYGICANGDTVLRGVPSLDLQYADADCDHHLLEFDLLGRLRSGLGNTGALVPGRVYNFYFEHADVTRCLLDFTIPSRDTVIKIESPVYNFYESVFVKFDTLNNRINFKWHNVLVPEKACEEYRKYY